MSEADDRAVTDARDRACVHVAHPVSDELTDQPLVARHGGEGIVRLSHIGQVALHFVCNFSPCGGVCQTIFDLALGQRGRSNKNAQTGEHFGEGTAMPALGFLQKFRKDFEAYVRGERTRATATLIPGLAAPHASLIPGANP